MPLSSMASSIYFTAASPMDSMVLSHSTAGLMDATPNTLEISWMISCLLSAPSARTKIRPSCLLTLMPSNFFKSFLIRSTSIRSKYGLFMPFRATSPHLTIKICSFFVSIRQSSPLSSILQASLRASLPFLQSPLCDFFLQSTLRGYRKLPSLRKRFTAAVTLSTTISISSISLNRPKLNRSAPSISLSFNPMAPSTWL